MSVYKRILTRYRNCADIMLLLCRSVSKTDPSGSAAIEATALACKRIDDPPYYMEAIAAQASVLARCCVYYGGGCFRQQEPAVRQRLADLGEEMEHLPGTSPDIQAKSTEVMSQALLTIARRSLGNRAAAQLGVIEKEAATALQSPVARTTSALTTSTQTLCLYVEHMDTDQARQATARILAGKARGLSMSARDAFSKIDAAMDLLADAVLLFAHTTTPGT